MRAITRTRTTTLVVAALAAASMAVTSLALGQTGEVTVEQGVVRLHLGDNDHAPDRDYFRFDAGNAMSGYTPGAEQDISTTNGCRLDETGPVMALSSNAGHVGFKDDTIGVRINGSQGVPCGQVNDLTERLSISLGPDLDEMAIDYAEIDLGAKFDVTIEFDLYLDGSFVGSPDPVVCIGSDCGPDSKDRDNVRKIIEGFTFDTIEMRVSESTPSAAFSLEGGADLTVPGPLGTTLGTNDTLFRVVRTYDGQIDCGDTISDGDGMTTPFASFTRYENTDGSTCLLKPYDFETVFDNGVEEVRFDPDDDTQPAAYSGVLTFLPEDGTAPFSIDGLEYDPEGDGTFILMQWCDEPLVVDSGGNVTSDPLPPGETWCILSTTSVTLGGSPVTFQTTWDVYGEDDPNFRPR